MYTPGAMDCDQVGATMVKSNWPVDSACPTILGRPVNLGQAGITRA